MPARECRHAALVVTVILEKNTNDRSSASGDVKGEDGRRIITLWGGHVVTSRTLGRTGLFRETREQGQCSGPAPAVLCGLEQKSGFSVFYLFLQCSGLGTPFHSFDGWFQRQWF